MYTPSLRAPQLRLLATLAASMLALSAMCPPVHAQVAPDGIYRLTTEAIYSVASPVPGMLGSRHLDISTSAGGVAVTLTLDGHPGFFDEVDNTVIESWQAFSLPAQQRYLLQVASTVDRALARPGYEVVVQASGHHYQCSFYECHADAVAYLRLRLFNHRATWFGQPTDVAQGSSVSTALDIQSPLTVRILDPGDGATVDSAVPISGTRTGAQAANQHVWIFVRPDDGSGNWWAHPDEVKDDTGEWQVTINFNGPPSGMRSELRVGAIGEESQQTILRHLRVAPSDPLEAGLPPDFHELDRISIVKA